MIKKILSTLFLIAGIIFISQGLFDISKRLGFYKVSASTYQTAIQGPKSEPFSLPVKITINSLSLNLPVEPVTIKDGYWPTSQAGISFLQNSGTLGKTGNLVFYGHNWKTLLGSLKKIKVGDKVLLSGSNGQDFLYTVDFITEVDQADVSILADSTDERLTLYTCSGFLDQKRLVVVAKRV